MSWSMKALLWICPVPTPPSIPRALTTPNTSLCLRSHLLSRPPPHHSLSSPASLPLSSPESCLVRDCLNPSTWSLLCPLPSPCAPTPLWPSTGPVWKTGMWCCEFYAVRNIGFKGSLWLLKKRHCFWTWTLPSPSHCPLQTLLMTQKDTASWALHPSWPSWDPIPLYQSFLVWSPFELHWLQLWKS